MNARKIILWTLGILTAILILLSMFIENICYAAWIAFCVFYIVIISWEVDDDDEYPFHKTT